MFHAVLWASLGAATAPAAAPAPPAATVIQFRTDAQPRIDPVFGDVAELRATIDRFLSLQGEMERVRDELSSAVHETLSALATATAASPGPGVTPAAAAPRGCPPSTAASYARALASGGRYL